VHDLRSRGDGGKAVLTQAIEPASDRAVHKQIADQLRAAE
jgi:hypothetical protein